MTLLQEGAPSALLSHQKPPIVLGSDAAPPEGAPSGRAVASVKITFKVSMTLLQEAAPSALLSHQKSPIVLLRDP